jgi:hypothetical protein
MYGTLMAVGGNVKTENVKMANSGTSGGQRKLDPLFSSVSYLPKQIQIHHN